MNEAGYKAKIKKLLKQQYPDVFCQAIGGVNNNGTPDHYYEALPYTLWIEYKYYKDAFPNKINLESSGKLSALQARWLERSYYNGQRVGVIIGCKRQAIILPNLSWKKEILTMEQTLFSDVEVVQFINNSVSLDNFERGSDSAV